MTSRHAWSKAILINAINGQIWENTLLNQQNFEETMPSGLAAEATSVIRDEYSFDFLSLTEPYTEAQLEQALLGNIRDFLASMGAILPLWVISLPSQSRARFIKLTCCYSTGKSKKRTIVEFALQDMTKPIGVATYTFTDALPKELSQFFPTSEQFIERVEKLAEAMNWKK